MSGMISEKTTSTEKCLLQAFQGTHERIPVWLMRQAGRFLPGYQKLRQKYSLQDMFEDPELAAQVTLMPVEVLNVDAAILFADILTLPAAMGIQVNFTPHEGPVIHTRIRSLKDVQNLSDIDEIPHISRSLELIKRDLPETKALIGFGGGPFSVLCYLIEGRSVRHFSNAVRLIFEQPDVYHRLMQRLTDNTLRYFRLQRSAGIEVFQIFDTWAGLLPARLYREHVLPYVRTIFAGIDLPSIYFVKNSRHLLDLLSETGADFQSLCSSIDLPDLLKKDWQTPPAFGVQGNLLNTVLFAPEDVRQREILRILEAGQKLPRYIFNLGHGILPETPVEAVREMVQTVQKTQRQALR